MRKAPSKYPPSMATQPKEKEPLMPPQDQALAPVFQESKLLDSLGITKKYVLNEYMKIVNQDEDLSNKLKAIKPLVKEIGIDIDGDQKGGITNNIIVMPAEITKKYKLESPTITGDPTTPQEQQIIDV